MSTETLLGLAFLGAAMGMSFITGWLCCRTHMEQRARQPVVREAARTAATVAVFSAACWKRPQVRALIGGNWTDADVDRAAAGDGELGIHGGTRCVVTKRLPED